MPDKIRILLNLSIFYIGWALCAFYPNFKVGLIVLALALVNILICQYKFKEILIIFCLAFIGLVNDLVAINLGIYKFTDTISTFTLSNLWLYSIWLMFLTTFNTSLSFLKRLNLFTLSLCGAVGGTLSYYIAIRSNVFISSDLKRAILYICLNWAILFPLLYKIYFRVLLPNK